MKNKIILFCSLIVLATTLPGCSDFFDKEPVDAIPVGEAMQTYADAQQHLTGIYSIWLSGGLYSGLLTLLPDIQADFVYMINGASNKYRKMYDWEFLASTGEIKTVYEDLYTVISRCNFYLENIDRVEAATTDKTERARLDRYTGEVYFSRALAYSELIKLYCVAYDTEAQAKAAPGVSITTRYNENNVMRSSLWDSYQQVLDDLEMAERLITSLSFNTDKADSYYFTPGVVYALQARVALYMKDYDRAIDRSTLLIEDDAYALSDATRSMPGATNYSPYMYMWEYDSGDEVIWRIGMTPTDYGSSLSYYFHKFDYMSYTPDYVPALWVYNLYGALDRRRMAFFTNITTGYYHGLTWPLLTKYSTNPDLDGSGNYKFVNMPKVFRLSEQYLIRAEAYYHKDKYSEANDDLATLRKARISNYNHIRVVDKDKLFTEIQNERVKELYMEGFRLQDLKRWNKGFTRKPQQESLSGPDALNIKADNNRFVWPIPQHEIDANPGIEQNPI